MKNLASQEQNNLAKAPWLSKSYLRQWRSFELWTPGIWVGVVANALAIAVLINISIVKDPEILQSIMGLALFDCLILGFIGFLATCLWPRNTAMQRNVGVCLNALPCVILWFGYPMVLKLCGLDPGDI